MALSEENKTCCIEMKNGTLTKDNLIWVNKEREKNMEETQKGKWIWRQKLLGKRI